jgi:uroporphyrinogen-III synthase
MRVIVTRPQAQAEPLLNALRAQGFEPIACPVIATEPIGDDPIDATGYDWVIVTSANGAAELAARHTGFLPRVAAVGELTAAALEAHGIVVEFVPALASQEGLLAELPRPVGRALFIGAERARRLLVDELGADFVSLYRTKPVRPAAPVEGDLVVLASPSAARSLVEHTALIPVVTIGPETTAAAEAAGLRVAAEARTHDLEGLVSAVGEAG